MIGTGAPSANGGRSYTAIAKFSILAKPTPKDFTRINDTSTSCPLTIRALVFGPLAGRCTPRRSATVGVITVMLAPVSRRNVAVWFPLSTTGTRIFL